MEIPQPMPVWGLLLVLLVATRTGTQASADIGEDSPPLDEETPPIFCECVYYFQCEDGVIIIDGSSLIDIRAGGGTTTEPPVEVNVEVCSDILKTCCRPPDRATTTAVTPTTTPRYPPDTPCECVPWHKCPLDRVVSDYGGNTTLEIRGLRTSHSQCYHSLAVCCAIETTTSSTTTPTTTTPTTPTTTASTGFGKPKCECVPFYQCDDEGYINEYGIGLIDVRMGKADCGYDDDLVCCYLRKDVSGTTNVTTSTTTVASTTTPTTTAPPTLPPPKYRCGTLNPAGTAVRVLGFKEGQSQFGEYPWVVALLRLEGDRSSNQSLFFVGGGSLIHPSIVLTAAHKVYNLNVSKLYVRLGEWDTQSQQEPEMHQDVKVKSVLVHPRFHQKALWFNVALLVLEEEARSAPNIHPICPTKSLENVRWETCVINGWGKNAFDVRGSYQKILKSVDVPLVAKNDCQRLLRKTRLGRFFRLHQSFICAGGEKGKDTCWGDGGGPLACPFKDTPDRYALVGVTSWGIGCGEEGVPGVYADVTRLYDWIMDNVYERFPTTTTSTTTTTTQSSTTERHQTTANPEATSDYSGHDDLYKDEYEDELYKDEYEDEEFEDEDELGGINREEKKKKKRKRKKLRKKKKKNRRRNRNREFRHRWRGENE